MCYLCAWLYQCLWMSYSCAVPLIHPGLSKTLSGCAYEQVHSADNRQSNMREGSETISC